MAKTSSAHALRCTLKRMYSPGALYFPGPWQVGRAVLLSPEEIEAQRG